MMMKKNAKRFTVVLVICAMLMNVIAMAPVSAEEEILPEAIVEEVVSVETVETVEPAAEEPEAEEPAAEEPAAEEPAAEEPATDKPAVEEPVVEEPEVEKPAVEEPVVEEPEEDEKIYIQMFVNGVATVYENPEVDEEHELCKMQNGEVIEVIKYDEDWYEVKTGGYIMKENLRLEAEKQIEEEPVAEESVTEEPVVEEAADEEPAADGESVAEESTVDEEPVVEEAATDKELEADEETIEDYETPLGIMVPDYVFVRDEEGNLVLDERGNPVVIVAEGKDIPVNYERDENGALVLDEEGEPTVTQKVPSDAVVSGTLVDSLNPDRSIDIYYSWNDEKPALGGVVTFIAVLYGYDNLDYSIQWQTSANNEEWTDLSEANGTRYYEVITRDNYKDYWRVQVTITDVNV